MPGKGIAQQESKKWQELNALGSRIQGNAQTSRMQESIATSRTSCSVATLKVQVLKC